MNRSSFIRSLFIIAAAPKIISEVVKEKSVSYTLTPVDIKKSYYIKVSQELLEDVGGFKAFINHELRNLEKRGLCLSKHTDIITGFEGEDFTRNLITLKIT